MVWYGVVWCGVVWYGMVWYVRVYIYIYCMGCATKHSKTRRLVVFYVFSNVSFASGHDLLMASFIRVPLDLLIWTGNLTWQKILHELAMFD